MSSFDFRTVLQPADKLTVFNPSKDTLQRDFGGDTYTFPAESTVDIPGVTHYKHNKEGELEPYYIPAATVVAHFLGEDGRSGHLGPLGVRVLSGQPEWDEKIRAEAYAVCKERLYLNDIAVRAAHLASVKVAKDAGQPAPSPSRPTLDAYNRIAEYEATNGEFNSPFKCVPCSIPFRLQELLDNHNTAHHANQPVSSSSAEVEALKATVAAVMAQNAAILEVLKANNQPRKPGRPRKAVEA